MAKAKAKTTKGKGRGKKAATKPAEDVSVADAVVEKLEDAAEAVTDKAKEVVEAAEVFVDKMTDAQNAPPAPQPEPEAQPELAPQSEPEPEPESEANAKLEPSSSTDFRKVLQQDRDADTEMAEPSTGDGGTDTNVKSEADKEQAPTAAAETEEMMQVDGNREQRQEGDEGVEKPASTAEVSMMSMDERQKKLAELRNRMRDSARQNRSELVNESTKLKVGVREAARREKQLRLAETLRERADAEERGEDVERRKNWEYTIAENDEWEKKKRRKERNADFEFHDEEQQARRRYKKDLNYLKPDLETYNQQKQLALGSSSGLGASSSNALTQFNPQGGAVATYEQQRAAESLYRDANTLLYADNKPSEEAIDRVIGKLNMEQDKRNKFSRKRLNEDEGDITYINERNRVFNKKIGRFYDKYTSEIRASFERGTAL